MTEGKWGRDITGITRTVGSINVTSILARLCKLVITHYWIKPESNSKNLQDQIHSPWLGNYHWTKKYWIYS